LPQAFSTAADVTGKPGVRWLGYIAAVFTGGSAISLVIASGGDATQARSILAAVPRTCNALVWVAKSMLDYSVVRYSHPDREGDEYEAALLAVHEQRAVALLNLCQKNGSLYIKAAQQISMVPAVPKIYRSTLEVLQDRVSPRPYYEIEQVLRQELGDAAVEDVFAEFQQEAIAAASLAQVHRAKLRAGGVDVAVKLQYPGLESAIAADVATFAALTNLVSFIYRDLQFNWVVENLRTQVNQEVDFRKEASNAMAFAAATRGSTSVHVPEVYTQLSSRKMLTMEWVEGIKISDKAALEEMGLRTVEVGQLLLQTFAEMAFVRGVIHQDPHPGNILVRLSPPRKQRWIARLLRGRRGRKPQLLLLDHGSYVYLGEQLRLQYCQLWCAFMLNDMATASKVAETIGGPKLGYILPLILRPGALNNLSKGDKERIRQESGISGVSDASQLVEMMPRALAQYIRVSGIVREQASVLGCSPADRLRISASCAARGLREGHNEFMGVLDSRMKRLELHCRILLLRCLAWTAQWWQLTTRRLKSS